MLDALMRILSKMLMDKLSRYIVARAIYTLLKKSVCTIWVWLILLDNVDIYVVKVVYSSFIYS